MVSPKEEIHSRVFSWKGNHKKCSLLHTFVKERDVISGLLGPAVETTVHYKNSDPKSAASFTGAEHSSSSLAT
jgi:hypothetical protein